MTNNEHKTKYRVALALIGLNRPTIDAMVLEGYDTIESLNELTTDEDIDKLVKHINDTSKIDNAASAARAAAATAATAVEGAATVAPRLYPIVKFPFKSIQTLKAMRFWYRQRLRTGQSTDPDDFTATEIAKINARMSEEAEIARTMKNADTPKTSKLGLDYSKWPMFLEEFKTRLSMLRGAAHIPLLYLIRGHEVATAAIAGITYKNVDEELSATTLFKGVHYNIDNTRLFNELKPLVCEGIGWSVGKRFQKDYNGRGAFLAIQEQAEGKAAVATTKTKAYAAIRDARYKGDRKNFSFQNYVQIHQDAHSDLELHKEPVPETKKVDDFLAGIQAHQLQTGKETCMGDDVKLGSFQLCQAFLATLVQKTQAMDRLQRNVSSYTTEGRGGGQGRGRGRGGRHGRGGGRGRGRGRGRGAGNATIANRNYPTAEWHALSSDEKAEVIALRKKGRAVSASTTSERPVPPTVTAPVEVAVSESSDSRSVGVAVSTGSKTWGGPAAPYEGKPSVTWGKPEEEKKEADAPPDGVPKQAGLSFGRNADRSKDTNPKSPKKAKQ
jgi:hypothetical protein